MEKSSQLVSKSKYANLNGVFRVVDVVDGHNMYMNEHGAMMYWSEYHWNIKLTEFSQEPVYKFRGSRELSRSAPSGTWVAAGQSGHDISGLIYRVRPGDSDSCRVESLHDDCALSTSTTRNANQGFYNLLPPLDESWWSHSGNECRIVVQEPGPATPCLTTVQSALWARNPHIRCAALHCLAKLHPDENTFKEAIAYAARGCGEIRTTAISIISDLATKDLTNKYAVFEVLAKCCLRRRDSDVYVGSDSRIAALDCIVRLGGHGFVPNHAILSLLCKLSRNADSSVRQDVLRHMPKIAQKGNESAIYSVLHILQSTNNVERKGSALNALSLVANRGDTKAVAAVVPLCGGRSRTSFWSGKSDRSEEVRSDALKALGHLCEASDDAAVRTIVEGMGDQWYCVTSAANEALRAVVKQGTAALKVVVREYLEHKDSRIRRVAFALAEEHIGLADSTFRCCLLKALSDVDADIRLDCIQAVTREASDADKNFRPTVLGMLSDKSVFVRFAAIAATARLCGNQEIGRAHV